MSRGPPRRYDHPSDRFRGFSSRPSGHGFSGRDGPPFKRPRRLSESESRRPSAEYGITFYEDDYPGFRHQEVGLGDFNDFSSINQKDIKLERNPDTVTVEKKTEQETGDGLHQGVKRKHSNEEISSSAHIQHITTSTSHAAKALPKSPHASLWQHPADSSSNKGVHQKSAGAVKASSLSPSPVVESGSAVEEGRGASQELQTPEKESIYQPVLEDISPAKPVSNKTLKAESKLEEPEKVPAEASTMSKEELLQGMEKADREIAQVEQHIVNLKKKQLQLEEEAAQTPVDPPKVKTPPPDQKRKSLVQTIYEENQEKAEAAHAKFEKLGISLPEGKPLYNQPSDLPCFHENQKRAPAVKTKLVRYFQRRRQATENKNRQLCKEYRTQKKAWVKRLERLEHNAKRKAKESKVREFYEKIFPEIKKQREQEERFSRMGARSSWGVVARSEAEFNEIMDNLQEKEANERHMRTLAVDPPSLMDAEERKRKFINKNGLIPDPLALLNGRKYRNIWTEMEKKIFKEKYVEYPKNFEMIKRFLENKSTCDCILYYYQTKKKEQYKQLTRKHLHKKRRRDQYGSSRDSTSSTKRKGITLNTGPSGHRGSGSEEDEDEMTDSAEESEGGEFHGIRVTASSVHPTLSSSMSSPAHTQMHTNKQAARPEHGETSRWSDKEIQIARQGLRDYGRDWDAISQRVVTKTGAQCKNFYFNYKKKMNLEALLAEHEASKMQRAQYSEDEVISDEDTRRVLRTPATTGTASSHSASKPVTTSSAPTPGRETRSMTAAAAAAAATSSTTAASLPTSTSSEPVISSTSRVVSSSNVSQPATVSANFIPSSKEHPLSSDRRNQDVGSLAVNPSGHAQAVYVLAGGAGLGHVVQTRAHGEHPQLIGLPVGHLHQGLSHVPHPGITHHGATEPSSCSGEAVSWHPHRLGDFNYLQLNLHSQGRVPYVRDSPSERGAGWGGAGLARAPPDYPHPVKTESSPVVSRADDPCQSGAHGKGRTDDTPGDGCGGAGTSVSVGRTSEVPKQGVVVINTSEGKYYQRSVDTMPSTSKRSQETDAGGGRRVTSEQKHSHLGIKSDPSRPHSLPPFSAATHGGRSSSEGLRPTSSVTPPASFSNLKPPPPLIQVAAREVSQKYPSYIDLGVTGKSRDQLLSAGDAARDTHSSSRDVLPYARESAGRKVRPEQYRETLLPPGRERSDHARPLSRERRPQMDTKGRDSEAKRPVSVEMVDLTSDRDSRSPRHLKTSPRPVLVSASQPSACAALQAMALSTRKEGKAIRDNSEKEENSRTKEKAHLVSRPPDTKLEAYEQEEAIKKFSTCFNVCVSVPREFSAGEHTSQQFPHMARVAQAQPSSSAPTRAHPHGTPPPHYPYPVFISPVHVHPAEYGLSTPIGMHPVALRDVSGHSINGEGLPGHLVPYSHHAQGVYHQGGPSGMPPFLPLQGMALRPPYHLQGHVHPHAHPHGSFEENSSHPHSHAQAQLHLHGLSEEKVLHHSRSRTPTPSHVHGSVEDKKTSHHTAHSHSAAQLQIHGLGEGNAPHRGHSRTPTSSYVHGSVVEKTSHPSHSHAQAQLHLHGLSEERVPHHSRSRTPTLLLEEKTSHSSQSHSSAQLHIHGINEEKVPHHSRSRTPTPSHVHGLVEEKPSHRSHSHSTSQLHLHGLSEERVLHHGRSRTPTPSHVHSSVEEKTSHPSHSHSAAKLHPHGFSEQQVPNRTRSCTPTPSHVHSSVEEKSSHPAHSHSAAQLHLHGLGEEKVPHRSRSCTPTPSHVHSSVEEKSSHPAHSHSAAQLHLHGLGEEKVPHRNRSRTPTPLEEKKTVHSSRPHAQAQLPQGSNEGKKTPHRTQRSGDISDQELANPFMMMPGSVYTRSLPDDLPKRPVPSHLPAESTHRARSYSPVSVVVSSAAEVFQSRTPGVTYLSSIPSKMPSMSEIRSRAAVIPELEEGDPRMLARVPSPRPVLLPVSSAEVRKRAEPGDKVETSARTTAGSTGKKGSGAIFSPFDTLVYVAVKAQRAETDLGDLETGRESHSPTLRGPDIESGRVRGEGLSRSPDQFPTSAATPRYGISTGLVPKPPPLMPITGVKSAHESASQMSLSVSTPSLVSPCSPSNISSPPGSRPLRAAVSPDRPPPLISSAAATRGVVSPTQQQQPRPGPKGPPPLISAGNTLRGPPSEVDSSGPSRSERKVTSPEGSHQMFRDYRGPVPSAANMPHLAASAAEPKPSYALPVRNIFETVTYIENPSKFLVGPSRSHPSEERPHLGSYGVPVVVQPPRGPGSGISQPSVFRPWVTKEALHHRSPLPGAVEELPGSESTVAKDTFKYEREADPSSSRSSAGQVNVLVDRSNVSAVHPGDHDSNSDTDEADESDGNFESGQELYAHRIVSAPSIVAHRRVRQLAGPMGKVQGTPERYFSDSENTLSAEESEFVPGSGDESFAISHAGEKDVETSLPLAYPGSEATDTAESSPAIDSSSQCAADSQTEGEGNLNSSTKFRFRDSFNFHVSSSVSESQFAATAPDVIAEPKDADSSREEPQEMIQAESEELEDEASAVPGSQQSTAEKGYDVTSSSRDQQLQFDPQRTDVAEQLSEEVVADSSVEVAEDTQYVECATIGNAADTTNFDCEQGTESGFPEQSDCEMSLPCEAPGSGDQAVASEAVASPGDSTPTWGSYAGFSDSTESSDPPDLLSPQLSSELKKQNQETAKERDSTDGEPSKRELSDTEASADEGLATDNQVPEITQELEEFPNYAEHPPTFPTFVGEFIPCRSESPDCRPDGFMRAQPETPSLEIGHRKDRELPGSGPLGEGEEMEESGEDVRDLVEEEEEKQEEAGRTEEETQDGEENEELEEGTGSEERHEEAKRELKGGTHSEEGHEEKERELEEGTKSEEEHEEEQELQQKDREEEQLQPEDSVDLNPDCERGETGANSPVPQKDDMERDRELKVGEREVDEEELGCATTLKQAEEEVQQEETREGKGNEGDGEEEFEEERGEEEQGQVGETDNGMCGTEDTLSEGEIVSSQSDQEFEDKPSEVEHSDTEPTADESTAESSATSTREPNARADFSSEKADLSEHDEDALSTQSSEDMEPPPREERTIYSRELQSDLRAEDESFTDETTHSQDEARENPLSPEEVTSRSYLSYTVPISPPAPESPNHESESDRVSPVPAWPPQTSSQSLATSHTTSYPFSQENPLVSSLAARLAAQRNPAFPYSALSINVGSASSSARSSPIPSVSFGLASSPGTSSMLPRSHEQTVLLSDNYEPLSDDEDL